VIPPRFGHILINPGPKHLVTSNWVSSVFSSEYELYKEAQGAAYFVSGPPDKPQFSANPHFNKLPEIKFVKPAGKIERFGLHSNIPMYPLIKQDAKRLDFLNRPLDFDYADVFC
ncbi:MAG: glucose-6-phosphate isomerase family protein, partial [Candidatus Omnitrophota bacterium]